MKALVEILICVGLVAVEFLAIAVLVAPLAVWRALCKVARVAGERLAGGAAGARERLEGLIRRRGPGLGQRAAGVSDG
jgi:hypothetical protein